MTTDEGVDPLDLFNDLSLDIQSRRQKHIEEQEQDFPGKTSPKNRGSRLDNPSHEWLHSLTSKEFSVGGVATKFYGIGALAAALGRKPVTIRSWESKGWIPQASFRTPAPKSEQVPGKAVKGRRLYSEAQLVFLVEAAMQFAIDDPKEPNWDGFRRYVAEHYPKR
jgi:hypothetical protein